MVLCVRQTLEPLESWLSPRCVRVYITPLMPAQICPHPLTEKTRSIAGIICVASKHDANKSAELIGVVGPPDDTKGNSLNGLDEDEVFLAHRRSHRRVFKRSSRKSTD
ncbi:hypothetical protein TNCV_1738221 [Trichonephila clavipes]|nr:hypothetical protein TNCV_1738221 [Trichonephila clavipes]